MTKAVFFDLFFTLIYPTYSVNNEYDVIGISPAQWENYAENDVLYQERARGYVKDGKEIINKIVNNMPYFLSEEQKQEILFRREERMKRALLSVNAEILETIQKLHNDNIKIGLISNADVIDSRYWGKSPLANLFDSVIFSCNVGMLKPEVAIYEYAMRELSVLPEECIFVGDGGSDELHGAKIAGMKTIFTEYLDKKTESQKEKIIKHADYHINSFKDILKIVH